MVNYPPDKNKNCMTRSKINNANKDFILVYCFGANLTDSTEGEKESKRERKRRVQIPRA